MAAVLSLSFANAQSWKKFSNEWVSLEYPAEAKFTFQPGKGNLFTVDIEYGESFFLNFHTNEAQNDLKEIDAKAQFLADSIADMLQGEFQGIIKIDKPVIVRKDGHVSELRTDYTLTNPENPEEIIDGRMSLELSANRISLLVLLYSGEEARQAMERILNSLHVK